MSEDQKSKLIFVVLRNYYDKFFYFFNDLEQNIFSEKTFIVKVLSSLDC